MANETLRIALGEPLRTFVLEQAAAAGYPHPADYVYALIDAERRHKAQSQLESLLVEGLDSGPSIEACKDHWIENRRKLELPTRR